MTKGSVAQKRAIFIEGMITAITMEEQIKAYRKAYPTCKSDNGARVQSYRLLQIPEVKSAIEEGRRKVEEEIEQAKRDERIRLAKQQVASEVEIDAVLSQIALGKYRRKRKQPYYNRETKKLEIANIEEEPTETDIVAAADKLYKRKGSYAATTVKHEGGDSFIDFMRSIAQLNNQNLPDALTGSNKKV